MSNARLWKERVNEYPDTPTLVGFPKNNMEIYVWCPYCHNFHVHGYSPNEFYQGHRSAHCGDQFITVDGDEVVRVRYDKPTAKSGYFIILGTHPLFRGLDREKIDPFDVM